MNKNRVYESYDKICNWFEEHRDKSLMEVDYLELMLQLIPNSADILDLGCGTGQPIAEFFIKKGYKITGIDGSTEMINLCKKRFPKEEWIVSNMLTINLNKRFDLILAWHSFFHLTHDAQRSMFKVFKKHIKPSGILAFTSGTEHGEVWSDNGGENLYHASLSSEEYEQLLAKTSFNVITHKIQDPNCGDATIWIVQNCENI